MAENKSRSRPKLVAPRQQTTRLHLDKDFTGTVKIVIGSHVIRVTVNPVIASPTAVDKGEGMAFVNQVFGDDQRCTDVCVRKDRDGACAEYRTVCVYHE